MAASDPTDIARSLSEAQREFGEKVDFHCPYDEATLRAALKHPGYHICPCCYSTFAVRAAIIAEEGGK